MKTNPPKTPNTHHLESLQAFMRRYSLRQLENLERHQAPATMRSRVTPNFPWQGMSARAHVTPGPKAVVSYCSCVGMTVMGTRLPHMQWPLKLCTHLNGKGKCSSYYQNLKQWRGHKYCWFQTAIAIHVRNTKYV